ncbi:hypothetical protein D3C87_166670 [compost metagenome]
MRKIVLYIIVTIVCSVSVIFLLNSYGNQNRSNNAFIREIKNTKLKAVSYFEFSDGTFRFSTKPDANIKLNKYSDRLNLYELDYSFKKLDTIKIKFPPVFYSKAFNVYKDILDSNIFCTNPYGDILVSDGKNEHAFRFKTFRFDWFQAISPNTIVVRGRYPRNKQNNRSIAKISLLDSATLDKEYPLPDLPNGLFTNDGMLLYDRANAKILYMYYYKGEFLALDTNLNLLYSSKTIDTVHRANINVKLIMDGRGKERKQTLIQATPPKIINSFITTNKNRIYIKSKLRSDNESQSEFDKNQAIDVYNIENGKYLSSFYIPKYLGKRVTQFQIKDRTLLAIYGTHIVKYNIEE